MPGFVHNAKPLLQAFLSAGLGTLAFAALSRAGFDPEWGLTAAFALAGVLNIYGLAAWDDELWPHLARMPLAGGDGDGTIS